MAYPHIVQIHLVIHLRSNVWAPNNTQAHHCPNVNFWTPVRAVVSIIVSTIITTITTIRPTTRCRDDERRRSVTITTRTMPIIRITMNESRCRDRTVSVHRWLRRSVCSPKSRRTWRNAKCWWARSIDTRTPVRIRSGWIAWSWTICSVHRQRKFYRPDRRTSTVITVERTIRPTRRVRIVIIWFTMTTIDLRYAIGHCFPTFANRSCTRPVISWRTIATMRTTTRTTIRTSSARIVWAVRRATHRC